MQESGDLALGEGGEFIFLNVKLVPGCLSGNLISETAGLVGGEELGVSEMEMSLYVEKTESAMKDGGEEDKEESNLNTLCNQAVSKCSAYMREALFCRRGN